MTDDPKRAHLHPEPASAPPGPTTADDPLSRPPHDAAGAYVLDALPEDERRAFEAHLATCPDCRRAVAELAPVVGVLPRLYDLEPIAVAAPGTAGAVPIPAADLGERIVAAAQEIARTDASLTGAADRPPPRPTEPPAPAARVVALRPPSRFASGWPAAAALAVVAAGAIVWALVLQLRLADKETTIDEQAAEIEAMRERATAAVFALAPTADGPSGAQGDLLYAAEDGFGVLYVRGLSPLPADKVYQLWYVQGGTPQPGGTFTVDAQGTGTLALTTDVRRVDAIALTVEPFGGSLAPTSAVLLVGETGAAAG